MCRKKKDDKITYAQEFTYKDLTAMEEFLEEKHREGLRLVKLDKDTMTFEKCEPSWVKYSCEIFANGDTFFVDREFVQMCEAGGWRFVAFDEKGLYVFKTYCKDTTDIMTDDKMKLSIIAKTLWRKAVFSMLGSLALYVIQIALWMHMMDFEDIVSSSDALAAIAMVPMILLSYIARLGGEFLWLIKRKAEVGRGEKLRFNNQADKDKYALYDAIEAIITCMLFLVMTMWFYNRISIFNIINILIVSLLIFIPYTAWNMHKKKLISKSLKKKTAVFFAVISVMIVGLVCLPNLLPKVPDETTLAEKISAELDLDHEIDVSQSRLAQFYDAGWNFKMLVSRNQKIRNRFMQEKLDWFDDVGYSHESGEKTLGEMTYYEYIGAEYAVVASAGDYVFVVHTEKDNAVQILHDALAAE
ncbi:MAG: DUF2812 domain-containing protein [Ruminococcus sp.]|nr:DUF2812 domain-containing protein [Ruminococcus sp.]